MSPENLLAIDNGTQSVRAMLFDPRGNLLARKQVHIEPYFSVHPGWAEQHPEVFWNAVCEACQGLFAQPGVEKESIAGVAITTQRSTVINLDKDGKPLRPAIVWLDQRRTLDLEPLGGLWGFLFKISGNTKTVQYLRSEAECNWLAKHQPEVWKNTHKYVLLSGYLAYRMTGEYVDSVASQVGYFPFDFKTLKWSGRNDWKWQALTVEEHMLVDLFPPSHQMGVVSTQAADETGIPQGLPLIAAAADKACEVIGAGCLDPHIACLSYGSSATINTTHTKYVETIPVIPPYPAAIPHAYSNEVQIFRGYWMVSWFKREFGANEVRLAAERGIEPEEVFNDLVGSVPAGSLGLMLQPYWSPGLKVPGPEAKGAVIGFGDVHTRSYLYRAILEGLAYALREGADRTSQRTKVPITEVRVAGGGSQSDAALQLTADIFGLPASRPHVYEASGLGAAIDAAVGLGLHPDFTSAVKDMTRVRDGFEPIPENQKLYNELYNRVYLQMYKRLKPLYDDLQEITGYPPSP